MFHKSTERGQALILIALAAIGLFAFAALAIDGSRSFSNKRHAQNAADTAVLTAALKYIRTGDYTTAQTEAIKRVNSNGYADDADASDGYTTLIDVDKCDNVIDINPMTGLPVPGDVKVNSAGVPLKDGSGNYIPLPCQGIAGSASEYIRVKIISEIPATFGRVLGRKTLTSAVEAIARVQGTSSSSGGDEYADAAMVSTSSDDKNTCFNMNGGAYVHTFGSGISVNCPNDQAIFMNSNMWLYMDAPGEVVGCYDDKNVHPDPNHKENGWFDPIKCHEPSSTPVDFTHEFDSAPTMPTPPDCYDPSMTQGSNTGGVLTPGYFTGNVIIMTPTDVRPGLYCFRNGSRVNVNSINNNMTQTQDGTVTFVFDGSGGFGAGSSKNTHYFKDLEVYTVDGSFTPDASNFTADILRFYSSGSGNYQVNSGGTLTSGDAYAYLAQGNMDWNSQAIINLHAPTNGTFRGLLLHKPWGNKLEIKFNGGTNHTLTGTFLAPDSPITFNGQTDFTLHSQLIGSKYTVNGGGKVLIYYDPADNWLSPNAPPKTIELSS